MFSHKCFFSLVFAVLMTVSIVSAGAQDYSADAEYLDYGEAGEELVITAGRIPEELKKVPAQVTVITANDIAQSGATSVVGVLETVPGVRFSGAMAGAGSEIISMRGFGENSYGRVLILVDGNKINDPDMKVANWNAIPLADIERIEVLDGSASVQYGNNAVGGVINIITKKGGERRTLIGISGGSFFNNRESISHFEPLSWGNFSIAAEHIGTDGYRERQESETVSFAGSSNVFIGDTMQLSFSGFFTWLYYQLPGGLSKDQFEDDPKQEGLYDLYDDFWTYIGTFPTLNDENTEYHFGGGLSFRWFPTEKIEFMLPLSYRGKSINSDMASSGSYTDRIIHSAEARPQGSVTFDIAGMPLRLLGGVDLYYTRLDADIYKDKPRTIPSNNFTISEWVIGPYITARFSPLEDISFSAGARFDTAIIKSEAMIKKADGNKTYHAFVYDAGIVYTPADTVKLYARYAALFRYPFLDELVQAWGYSSDTFNSNLKPEKGYNVETGATYQIEDILRFSANFFFMQLEDEIFPNASYINVNMNKTRRFGTNAGFNLTPFEWVSLDASYSWVYAFFAAGPDKNRQVPLVPKHKIYGSLLVHLLFGLSFGPDIEYVSTQFAGGDASNTEDLIDAYFLWGARARFVLDKDENKLVFQITAKNLLNKRYAPMVFYGAYYPGDGFSLNVSLQYRF